MNFDAVKHRFKPLSSTEIDAVWARLKDEGMAGGSMLVEDIGREEKAALTIARERQAALPPEKIKRLRVRPRS